LIDGELLCCPGCGDALDFSVEVCRRCSRRYRRDHGVVDFLLDGAARVLGRDDFETAQWLLDNNVELHGLFEELRYAHEGLPADRSPHYERLRRAGWITSGGRARLTESGAIIADDIRRTIAELPQAEIDQVEFLRSAIRVDGSSRVVDVGCSSGLHLRELAAHSPERLLGVDIDLFALTLGAMAWKRRGVKPAPWWLRASATALPLRARSVSHVISLVAFDYLPVRPALAEVARILEPGGWFVVTVEGPGYWRRAWARALPLSLRRLNLLREAFGNWLLPRFDWQRSRLMGRLSRRTYFEPEGIRRLLDDAGLRVAECVTLREHAGAPSLIGLVARKRD
jgi:SAM-dependent methyltransferase